MREFLKTRVLPVAILAASVTIKTALAEPVTLAPLPDPATPTAPAGPSGAQDSHDARAIEQLMKIVELARSLGGGVLQLITSAQTQEKALSSIRDASVGVKPFPVQNSGTDVAAREGGTGLKDMADAAIAGAPVGPPDFVTALGSFRTLYLLDDAFALATGDLPAKVFLAHLAATGATAAAMGEDSYKRANASMARIDGYIAALQASADLKTSLDINTRVQIELVQQMNESLRTQSALAALAGAYFMALGGSAALPDSIAGLKDFNR